MSASSGTLGRIMRQPYDTFHPASGDSIRFHDDFIEALDGYFSSLSEHRMVKNHYSIAVLFVSFADGGADNADGACAALDHYLSTLTEVPNA